MVSGRSLEAATALITGAFGAAVVVSSLDNGIGWSTAGVESGTFPFIVGLVILAGSAFNLVQGWLHARAVILGPSELRRLAILFVPAVVFVGIIPLIGMYAASALYMFAMLAIQSKVSVLRSALIALATAFSLYLVFERMFRVSLPEGLLGKTLGF